MAYTDYLDQVQRLYMGYYLRPADPAGLIYWAQQVDAAGGDLTQVIEAFADSPESDALWGEVTEDNIEDFVNDVYNALFNRDAEVDPDTGENWWVTQFKAGLVTPEELVLAILEGAQGEDLAVMENKLDWCNTFTSILDPVLDDDPSDDAYEYAGDADADAARGLLAAVDADTVIDEDTIEQQIIAAIAGAEPNPGDTFILTPQIDNFVGTDADDTFRGSIGWLDVTTIRETTYNSGDFLDGGDGNDTLLLTVAGEPILTGAPIAEIQNIENVEVRNFSGNGTDLDAAFWSGVDNFKLSNSNADVGIDNIGESFSMVTMDNIDVDDLYLELEVENNVFTGNADEVTVVVDNAGAGPIPGNEHAVDDDIWRGYTFNPDGTQNTNVGWPDYNVDGEAVWMELENEDGNGVVEIFNVVSTGGNSRGNFIKFDDYTIEVAKELNISGDTDLYVNFDGDQNFDCDQLLVETVDASALAANLWLRGANSVDPTSGDGVAIIGAQGDNDLTGGHGNDTFTTKNGNDTINGGAGNDSINAGHGDNDINAGMGDDTIITGDGNDFIRTGGVANQNNTFVDYNDVDEDGDTIEDLDYWNFQDTVNAGAGDDIVQVGDGLSAFNYDLDTVDWTDPTTYFVGPDDIDGGADWDILWMDAEAAERATDTDDDTFADLFDNFEAIKFGNIGDYYGTVDMAYLDDIQYVILGWTNSDANILGLSDGAYLEYEREIGNTVTVELTDDGGDDESFNVFLNGGSHNDDYSPEFMGNLSLDNVEILNLETGTRCNDFDMADGDITDGIDPSFLMYQYDLEMDSLATLNISGTTGVDLSGEALETVETVVAVDLDGGLILNLMGNANDVTVTSGDGADDILGGDGIDTINTGDGDDIITGGFGGDILTGGDGADRFNFEAVTDSQGITAEVDVIQDFVSGEDLLDFFFIGGVTYVGEAEGYGAVLTSLHIGTTTAVLDSEDSKLYVDANADAILDDNDMIIQLVGVTELDAATDFV